MKLLSLCVFGLLFISAAVEAAPKTMAFYLRMASLDAAADSDCTKAVLDVKYAACSANAGGTDKEILVKQGQDSVVIWNGTLPGGEPTSAILKAKFYFQTKGALVQLSSEPGLDVELIVPQKKQQLHFGHWLELAIANHNGKKVKLFGRVLQKSPN